MSVIHLSLLQLFELASLEVVQLGCLYLAVRMYWFVDILSDEPHIDKNV